VTPVGPAHFCYTGGFRLPEFPGWLREYGVRSATTCDPGLVDSATDPMLLPRFVDTTGATQAVFENWVGGISAFLPKRPYVPAAGQLMEEEAPAPSSATASNG
jgi:hypothetical protein